MGYGPVLTEDTTEIAVGEKDGAGSMLTHQRDLFSKMGVSAEDHCPGRSPAEPCFPFQSIHPTLPRTEATVLEDPIGFLDSLSQDSLLIQFRIGRLPLLCPFLLSVKGYGRQEY
jgi:hypothetical protein